MYIYMIFTHIAMLLLLYPRATYPRNQDHIFVGHSPVVSKPPSPGKLNEHSYGKWSIYRGCTKKKGDFQ